MSLPIIWITIGLNLQLAILEIQHCHIVVGIHSLRHTHKLNCYYNLNKAIQYATGAVPDRERAGEREEGWESGGSVEY